MGSASEGPVPPAAPTGPVAFLFPGQGSQVVGMLADAAQLPAVKAMLETAHQVLGYDLLDVCTKGRPIHQPRRDCYGGHQRSVSRVGRSIGPRRIARVRTVDTLPWGRENLQLGHPCTHCASSAQRSTNTCHSPHAPTPPAYGPRWQLSECCAA